MFIAILTTVTIGVTLLFPSLGITPSEVVEVIQPEILSTPEIVVESEFVSVSESSERASLSSPADAEVPVTNSLEVPGTGPSPVIPDSGPVGTSVFGYTAGYSPISPSQVIDTPTRSEIDSYELHLATNSSFPAGSPVGSVASSVFPSPIEYPGRHPNTDASVASVTSSQENLYQTIGERLAEFGTTTPLSQFDVEPYLESPATVYSDDVNHYGDPASPEYKYGGSEYNY